MNDLRLLAALLSALTLAACSDSEPTAQTTTDNRPTTESALERDLDRTAQAAGELADDAERTLEGAIATSGDAIEAIVEESETLAAEATDATGEGLEQAGEGLENLADDMGNPNAVVGTLAEATDATGEELEQVGDLLEQGARQLKPEAELETVDQAAMETTSSDSTAGQSPEEIEEAMDLGQTLARQGVDSDHPSAGQIDQAMEQGMTLAQQDTGTESQASGQTDPAMEQGTTMAEGGQSAPQSDPNGASPQQTTGDGQQDGQRSDAGQQPQLVSGPGTNVDPRTQEAISEIVQEAGQTIEQLLKGEISPDEARAQLGQAGSTEQSADRLSPYPADVSSDDVEQTAREAIDRIMTTAQEAIDRIVHQTAQASRGQAAPEGEGMVEQAREAAGQAAETTEETVEDAARATEQTAREAVEATEETLGEAAQATEAVVEDTVEATGEALQEAEQVVEEAVEDTGQAIEEAAQEAGEALGIVEGEQPDTRETVAEEAGEIIATEGQQATQDQPDDQAQGRDDTATRRQDEPKPAAALPGVVQPHPAARQQQAPTEPLSTQGTGVSGEERIESLRDSDIPEEMVDTIEENLEQAESNQPTNRPEQTVPEYQMTDQDDAVPQTGEQGGTLDKPMGNTMDPNFRTQTPGTVGDEDDQPRTGPEGGGMLDTDEGPGPYTENQPGGKFDDPSYEERGLADYPQGQREGVVKVEGEEEPRPAGASAQGEVMGAGGAASGGQQTGEADSRKMPALDSETRDGDEATRAGAGQPTDNQTGPLGEADAYKEPVEHSDFQVEPDEAATSADEAEGRVEQMLEDATRPSGDPKPFDAARQAEQTQD